MFRQGKPRTFNHNLRLATMLSFVAGIVNICGVLAIGTLTTNVTGHFAFFAEEFVQSEYRTAAIYIIYILAFLFGAFISGLLIEIVLRKNSERAHALPMAIEIITLSMVAALHRGAYPDTHWIACLLLFAMGVQNALVTKVSQATVRTTHLTGLFTDLGIELSQLIFYKERADVHKLSRSIYLRLAIITFFFIGGVVGGFMFAKIQLNTLFIASLALVIALFFDNMKLTLSKYWRTMNEK